MIVFADFCIVQLTQHKDKSKHRYVPLYDFMFQNLRFYFNPPIEDYKAVGLTTFED